MVKVAPDTVEAIKAWSASNDIRGALRLQVQTSGCCEPILAASFDEIREDDLVEDIDGLQIAIDPSTYRITGEICIELAEEESSPPLLKLSPNLPLSEWSGFLITPIKKT